MKQQRAKDFEIFEFIDFNELVLEDSKYFCCFHFYKDQPNSCYLHL
jgi:hypothetical protein